MLSYRFRQFFAGLGIFSIAGLGMLSALPAQAAVVHGDDAPYYTDPNEVTIGKTLISNNTIIAGYGGAVTVTFNVQSSPCSVDGCVSQNDIDALNVSSSVTVTAQPNQKINSSPFLPTSGFTKPGIYQWRVTESNSISMSGYNPSLAFSNAQYYVRASVKLEGGNYVYNWITIIKHQNDDGTPAGDVKVENLDFVNVAQDTGRLEITKSVENNSGVTEVGPYKMQVVFDWPANYNGVVNGQTGKWTTSTPNVLFVSGSSEHTDGSCVKNETAQTTTCTFTLDKNKKAVLAEIPVGSTYTVTENIQSSQEGKFAIKSISPNGGKIPLRQWRADMSAIDPFSITTEEECLALNDLPEVESAEWDGEFCWADGALLGADQVLVTVTNKYEDVTPTGLMLEYLPYVLMVIIPFVGIGAYVAMRRKILG